MKVLKNIFSILLVTAFFNVVIAKSAHEFFEHGYEHSHEHEDEICLNKDLNHFHQHEFAHLDFICDFNFSVSLFDAVFADFDKIIRYQENKIKIHFLWLAKNLCSRSISLRGPPLSV
ncbi:MAG: hypothetical protein P8Q14_08675 [Vicingaceae bacterium]|nr:hypothetical protein [Vicingaceae bacterium]